MLSTTRLKSAELVSFDFRVRFTGDSALKIYIPCVGDSHGRLAHRFGQRGGFYSGDHMPCLLPENRLALPRVLCCPLDTYNGQSRSIPIWFVRGDWLRR